MKIENTKVYGVDESIIASGYPMSVESGEIGGVREKDYKRAYVLGGAKSGSGHDCFLKGCIVQADFTMPLYVWKQAQRYHWFDIVSSQSTMHRLTKMDLQNQCCKYVLPETIAIMEKCIKNYLDDPHQSDVMQIMYANVPNGLKLTARVSTNYLQLKTMYNQRRTHKLDEWDEFCAWCRSLPLFVEMALKGGE
jgi:hypothetical protein